MDKNERYELLVKLSDFYVKKVKYNLPVYNKAIMIANVSIVTSWFSILIVLAPYILFSLWQEPPAMIVMSVMFIMFILFSVCYIISHILVKMDAKNSIHVLNAHGLPISADNEIKNYLMKDFVEIFGDFEWDQSFLPTYSKSGNFIKSLKILNTSAFAFDDYISGSYKDVNVEILEANTSFWQPVFIQFYFFVGIILVILFPFIYFGLFVFWCVCFAINIYFGGIVMILSILLFLLAIFYGVLNLISKFVLNKLFRGVFVIFDMNKKFESHTFIIEKNNAKENLVANLSNFEVVNLEDVEFEKEYTVYSQNQVEARYIMTTAVIERLKNIKKAFNAKYIRVAFKDEKFVIAIHTGRDMFKMADIMKPTGKETFVQMFEEIVSVLELVDDLKLNSKLGL